MIRSFNFFWAFSPTTASDALDNETFFLFGKDRHSSFKFFVFFFVFLFLLSICQWQFVYVADAVKVKIRRERKKIKIDFPFRIKFRSCEWRDEIGKWESEKAESPLLVNFALLGWHSKLIKGKMRHERRRKDDRKEEKIHSDSWKSSEIAQPLTNIEYIHENAEKIVERTSNRRTAGEILPCWEWWWNPRLKERKKLSSNRRQNIRKLRKTVFGFSVFLLSIIFTFLFTPYISHFISFCAIVNVTPFYADCLFIRNRTTPIALIIFTCAKTRWNDDKGCWVASYHHDTKWWRKE